MFLRSQLLFGSRQDTHFPDGNRNNLLAEFMKNVSRPYLHPLRAVTLIWFVFLGPKLKILITDTRIYVVLSVCL